MAAPKKKGSLLPLLTVVFLASYGLMTMLIVEQNTTIQAQSNLIHVLLGDSRELWAMKAKAIGQKPAQAGTQSRTQGSSTQVPSTQAPSTQAPSTQAPSTQAPSTQTPLTQGQSPSVQTPSTRIPSTQTPSTQTPSTQAVPQHHVQSRAGKTAKPKTQVPPMPASDLTDQRRVLITI
jgi:hypothetical protein